MDFENALNEIMKIFEYRLLYSGDERNKRLRVDVKKVLESMNLKGNGDDKI